ncbi:MULTISPECIES: TRAP transporter substrate-binding protein [unclassified Roseitalea]|uniref:TRAP transporter substrate-binding protein n=1 Tax=unclassified Roseitalea TaxID=2639107 RepID=UPI00273D27EF|nr:MULTISPECIES: TRAP transporter substrate-binding protein [unclassified Roseitalea]
MATGRNRAAARVAGAAALAALAMLGTVAAASGQDVTLRLHQFLPPQSTVPAQLLEPWAEKIEAESDGRIAIEIYSAMALGGRPTELVSQVRDGVVDLVYTLPGYTPGLFPRVEVFELPFTGTSAEATSRAFWEVFETEMKDTDFRDYHMIATWVHGPGVIHAKGEGVRSLDNMARLKLRAPTRVTNKLLGELGATAIGMPVPAIPESLSKGVIDGAVVPWEVTPSLRVAELTETHTEFGGETMFYTAAFILAMNKRSYERLPDDLKAVIDANSGGELSGAWGAVMEQFDAPARKIATDRGNTIVRIEGEELARWQAAAAPVIDAWIAEMDERGIDGAALLEKARSAIEKYSATN